MHGEVRGKVILSPSFCRAYGRINTKAYQAISLASSIDRHRASGVEYQIEGYFQTDPNGLIIFNMRHK